MGRPWVGLEIRVRGLASHPRAHTRAKYELVPANYALPRPFPTLFPIKSVIFELEVPDLMLIIFG